MHDVYAAMRILQVMRTNVIDGYSRLCQSRAGWFGYLRLAVSDKGQDSGRGGVSQDRLYSEQISALGSGLITSS